MRQRIITLITDFGERDEYAGVMKGVILRLNPSCQVVDVAHQISPQGITEASFILGNAYPYFPQGTIHVVVVDPGVGSSRRPIVLSADGHLFVGPDNGVFTTVYLKEGEKHTFELTNKQYFLPRISSTFQGRDVFAPVAAHLSLGLDPGELGREISDPVILDDFTPEISRNQIKGKVIHIDRFGNLITNISRQTFISFTRDKRFAIRVAYLVVNRVSDAYYEGKEGDLLALFSSSDWLEISMKNGNAKELLKVGKGEEIVVTECEPGRCGLL
ncbi:MAG: SAM-dependent chlorinase/fluorinase [Proteobacteria bacterium]|nr:SAM-dependent chlorinase/fluorinase [Pseudomonadota bacterium]